MLMHDDGGIRDLAEGMTAWTGDGWPGECPGRALDWVRFQMTGFAGEARMTA